MNIEGLIGGALYLIATVATGGTVDTKLIWNTAVIADRAVIKTQDRSWNPSIHEEGYQITKDIIKGIGKR